MEGAERAPPWSPSERIGEKMGVPKSKQDRLKGTGLVLNRENRARIGSLTPEYELLRSPSKRRTRQRAHIFRVFCRGRENGGLLGGGDSLMLNRLRNLNRSNVDRPQFTLNSIDSMRWLTTPCDWLSLGFCRISFSY
jgi:hypothetical protein